MRCTLVFALVHCVLEICVFCMCAEFRRRCCTGKRCTAVFLAFREGALFVPVNSLRH
jgi:hypothetical protein